MNPLIIIVIKYSGILLIWTCILWWVTVLSPIDVLEYIPHTPIKLYGLLFFGFTLTILIIAQKEILEKNPTFKVVALTLLGALVCFIREVIFQFILSSTEKSDQLFLFVKRTTMMTAFDIILSFFVAFQLKTKRTGRLVLIIFIFIFAFKLLTIVFPTFFKS
jgi:hypothetical protein